MASLSFAAHAAFARDGRYAEAQAGRTGAEEADTLGMPTIDHDCGVAMSGLSFPLL